MTSSEQSFLCELIQQKQPKKLLELGVAAGSSSVIILNSIKDIQGSHLTSVDYLTLWYRDESKSTGFVVDNYPELKKSGHYTLVLWFQILWRKSEEISIFVLLIRCMFYRGKLLIFFWFFHI